MVANPDLKEIELSFFVTENLSLTVLCSLVCTDNGKPKFEKAEKGAHAVVEPSSPKKTATLSSQPSATKAEKRVSGNYSGGSLQDVFDDFCSFGAGSGGKVRQHQTLSLPKPQTPDFCSAGSSNSSARS